MQPKLRAHTTLVRLVADLPKLAADREPSRSRQGAQTASQVSFEFVKIELKSLILAQIERWRHALHMQVERGGGATLHSVANG